MRALQLHRGRLELRDVPLPDVRPELGEALVRVRMAGICRTDLELAKGYMQFDGTLGHELCGEVVSHPDAAMVGERVVAEINLACGRCEVCRAGLERHCPERQVLGILGKHGCMAEYVSLPARNLHVLPAALDDERACFVEPLAAAYEILEQIPGLAAPRTAPKALSPVVSERSVDAARELGLGGRTPRVAVLGDGKLGQLIARVLLGRACELHLVGKHDEKLALARAVGIETASLDALTSRSFDVVVEATGSQAGMRAALQLLRPRGLLVLKSTYHGMLSLDAAPLVIDEISLVGSRCGPFAPAIEALQDGSIDPTDLIAARFPLAEAETAFERAAQPGMLKVLIDLRER